MFVVVCHVVAVERCDLIEAAPLVGRIGVGGVLLSDRLRLGHLHEGRHEQYDEYHRVRPDGQEVDAARDRARPRHESVGALVVVVVVVVDLVFSLMMMMMMMMVGVWWAGEYATLTESGVDVGDLVGGAAPRMVERMRAAILREYVSIAYGAGERLARARHVVGLPRVAVYAVDEELLHLLALGGHYRRAAAHRLQVHLAERLRDRGVHEVVGRGVRGRQLLALQEAHEVALRRRKQRLQALLVRTAAHNAQERVGKALEQLEQELRRTRHDKNTNNYYL